VSVNITENYSITNHSTNLSERSEAAVTAAAAATVDLIAQSQFATSFDGGTFTLIDAAGISKTYIFDDDNALGATGAISSLNIVIQINGLGSLDTISAQMAAAIVHENGHNGTISATALGGATGKVVLVQAVLGVAGNKSIGNTTDAGALSISYAGSSVTSFQNGANDFHAPLTRGPFRGSVRGPPTIRFQSTSKYYQSFIGEQRH
jgi:hypothetical protein